MNAPKRWSDVGGGATRDEKALLEAGANETMPNDLRERLWASIALATVASSAAATVTAEAAGRGSLGSAATAAPTTKGLTLLSSSLAKGVVALAMFGGIGTGTVLLDSKPAAKSTPTSSSGAAARSLPVASAPTSAATRANEPESDSKDADSAPQTAPPPSAVVSARHEKLRSAASAELPVSRLREESLAVLAIRKSLLARQASEALRLLADAQRDFPGGVLTEEREALTVRALLAAGQKAAAQRRGAAFLKSFPRSAHAAEVRRLLDD